MNEEIEPTDNKRLLLLRVIHNDLRGDKDGISFLWPEYLLNRFNINLQTIQSVLAYLEDRELIEIDQKPNLELTPAQREKRDDEEDYFRVSIRQGFASHFEIINTAAMFYGADIATDKPQKLLSHEASLSFKDMIYPVVTVGAHHYSLPSMYNSSPLNIITFCIDRHPAETIGLQQLKEEMKKVNLPLHGVDRLTTALRRTHFDKDGPLRPFVSVSSKSITVNPIVHLNQQQLQAIINTSQKAE